MRKNQQHHQVVSLIPDIRRYAYSLTGLRDQADDLLQKTLEKLLGNKLPEPPQDKFWALRVCRNAWVDELRRESTGQRLEDSVAANQSTHYDGETAMINKLTSQEVLGAMQKLDPDLRDTLSLVTLEGFSYADTANFLDIPIGTVMSRVARARKHLTALLSVTGNTI
jgi:RNA polymerase sigma factor (sigma-70 family)